MNDVYPSYYWGLDSFFKYYISIPGLERSDISQSPCIEARVGIEFLKIAYNRCCIQKLPGVFGYGSRDILNDLSKASMENLLNSE